ncbi:P-loop containing nucleoside triphosphate hydrolase [Sesbania bispinosa]|nr:P-loop containing nucleoside triphosphate hydrolase [Sesbania bispinosa]
MEGSDIYRASNSLRASSSTVWRNSTMEVFSRSSRREEEDDEEALKWAALEKLPTYNRLRKGLLATSRGVANEIDINDLGFQERQKLLDRLVNVAEEDNEKFLLKLKERIDRVGIDIPTIEVRYEHLNVEAEAYVGSRALPSFLNFATNIVESFLTSLHILSSKKKHVTILKDVSGIVKPRRMTLLLGPPSSGKTTLLLALSGKLDPSLKVSGRVTYNGHGMNEFVPQRTAAYISQHDVHIGEMTVRETLAFSARCQGVGSRYDLLAELSRREKEGNIKPDPDVDVFMKATSTGGQEASLVTDYVLKILGLDICADTMVGDEMLRGISGGQRKRVTTGEMLVGPANALFMDEISTGLDSSTTFQIVSSLRQYVHILNGTADPRENVLDFFESMGFKCPERKGVADFLQEVSNFKKDQEQYWVRRDEPYRFVTVTQFVEAFQSFHVGRKTGDELAIPFDKSKNHPAALTTNKYGVNKKELLRANFSREYLLMKRNSFVYIFKISQLTIMAILTMTLFLRTEMHRDSLDDGGVYLGALFFTVVMIMFNGMAEISMAIAKLPIFYKQRDLLFYPSWAYAIPTWILKIPITFVEVAVWVFLTYYVIGFDPNVGRLLKQYVLLLLINQMASGLFRAIAALGRNMIVANTFGSFALLTFLTLGGFIISRKDIKSWWIWAYWVSPLMYGQNAIVVNEFLGNTFDKPQATINEESEDSTPNDRTREVELPRIESSGKADIVVDSSHGKKKGMVLPFEPHSITFDQVVYSVDMPQEMKDQGVMEDRLVLLKGVSGAFRPGVLTALMGVSGAGKTTLMDVLAGRKTGGYIDGSIKVSGYPKKQETFARISGYCEQNDIHSPQVTVYESLLYSAWLRLPAEVDSDTRKMFIEEVMELVELNPLRNSLVGLPGVNGLSTEQRKRLTIAVELVANPSIIFMDEPTSGLDARAAAIVMRTVRNTRLTQEEQLFAPSINQVLTYLKLLTRRNKQLITELGKPAPGSKDLHFPTQYSQSLWVQCLACLWKQHWSYWRNPPYTAVRFLFTTFIALMFGTVFWDLGGKYSNRQDLFNAIGSMYTAVLFLGVQNSASVQPVVAVERTVFYRERAAGMYSALPYALAQRIPIWWRWYYWACPVAWTIYGLVASQFGDIDNVMELENKSVQEFIRSYFGIKHDFIGVCAVVVVGTAVLFAFIFAVSIKVFNFQRR